MITLFITVIQSWQIYNNGKAICRSFHILSQNERELNYYHQNVDISVESWVAGQLKIQDLRKVENFKEISEILGIDGQVLSIQKENFGSFVTNLRKISLFHRKTYFT